MRILDTLSLAAVAALAVVAAAGAQSTPLGGSVIVTPYVGAYVPASDVAKMAVNDRGANAGASLKQQPAAAFGATLSYWFTPRLGVEGGALFARSDLEAGLAGSNIGTTIGHDANQHANLWLMSTKLMVQLLPPESNYNLRFGIGPALITRSGDAYREEVGKDLGLTDVGAALSLCTRIKLTPKVGLRLRGEDFIYSAKLGYDNPNNPIDSYTFGSRVQHDFVFSAGLQFFMNR